MKKIAALITALCLALALAPVAARAEEPTEAGMAPLELTSAQSGQDLSKGGSSWRLNEDQTVSNTITITGNATVDLNGHSLAKTGNDGSLFLVESGGSLTIKGDALDRGQLTATNETDEGGAICVERGGTLTCQNIDMENCSARLGGAIYCYDAKVHLTDTNIIGCTTSGNLGGGICAQDSTVTMSGGEINTCSAGGSEYSWGNAGGGICLDGGTLQIDGGSVLNCTAYQGQGGCIWANGILRINDGKFGGNPGAAGLGEAIYFTGSDYDGKGFYLNGGTVMGELYINSHCTLHAGGGKVDHLAYEGNVVRDKKQKDYTTFSGKVENQGGTIDRSAQLKVEFQMYDKNYQEAWTLKGQTVGPPQVSREGYTLLGWYRGDQKFDFAAPIMESMRLTARWATSDGIATGEGLRESLDVDDPRNMQETAKETCLR